MRISLTSKSISTRLRRSLLATCILASPALGQQATVGAYYYPWWSDTHPRGHDFDKTHRAVLAPATPDPLIGQRDSRDLWTIASHIDQSQAANISLWVSSWWGPNSFENEALRNNIQTHPHASRIQHAVFYESDGRLRDKDAPNWQNLSNDFDYLARNILTDPNYYTVDDNPAVFIYLSRAYLDTPEAGVQLANVRQEVKDNHGLDLYLVGDHVFGGVADGAENFDAITAYDVYGQTHKSTGGTFTGNAERLGQTYANAAAEADALGVDLIPTVAPGYNDRQTRLESDNPAAARYYEDRNISTFGDPFEDMINLSAKPNVDADVNNLILVNSFNEWHEDTQIEALAPYTTGVTTVDITDGNVYTQGKAYEPYGTRYLDILRQTTGGPAEYAIFNGIVGDGNQDGQLTTDDIIALGTHWMQDSSQLTLREIAQHGDWDLDGTTDQQDLELVVGYLNDDGITITLEEAWALIPLPPGDYNLSGTVDAADYTVWQDGFGSTTALDADGNGNGIIDAADYTIWQDNFGVSISGGHSSSVVVPEPVSLASFALMGLLGRRRHGR